MPITIVFLSAAALRAEQTTLTFSDSGQDQIQAVARDALGYPYVAGVTNLPDFPVKNAAQPQIGSSQLMPSADRGVTWATSVWMHAWMENNGKFHPHAAQYDFEAWLLPFWKEVQELAGHDKAAPSGAPESDAGRIRRGKDLTVAAEKCPEVKAFLNTILTLSGADPL